MTYGREACGDGVAWPNVKGVGVSLQAIRGPDWMVAVARVHPIRMAVFREGKVV